MDDVEGGQIFAVVVQQIFSILSVLVNHSCSHLIERVGLIVTESVRGHAQQVGQVLPLSAGRQRVQRVVRRLIILVLLIRSWIIAVPLTVRQVLGILCARKGAPKES